VTKRSLIEPAVERVSDQWKLLIAVAEKAVAMGKVHEAERLMASATADYQAFAQLASTPDALAELARMRKVLTPVLQGLEAATGKPWTRCLDAGPHPTQWSSRRGQA
jgi:hypothetical protein